VQPIKRFQVRGARGEVVRIQFGERYVDYWAPPEPTTHLLVTHDGQNIFDKATATKGKTWELAKAATKTFERKGLTPPRPLAATTWKGLFLARANTQLSPLTCADLNAVWRILQGLRGKPGETGV